MKGVMMVLWAVVCPVCSVCGQPLEAAPGMAFSHVAMPVDSGLNTSGFIKNPALLSGVGYATVSISAMRKYGLEGLGDYSIAGSIPTLSGVFGAFLWYSGSALYNSSNAGFSYGREAGNRLRIGLGFEVGQLTIRGYGKAISLGAIPGLVCAITPDLIWGISLHFYLISNAAERGSQVASGLSYRVSSQVTLGLEVSKPPDRGAITKIVTLYRPHPLICIGMGLDTRIPGGWLSAGWIAGRFRVDIESAYHSRLGISPGIRFHFFPRRKRQGGEE